MLLDEPESSPEVSLIKSTKKKTKKTTTSEIKKTNVKEEAQTEEEEEEKMDMEEEEVLEVKEDALKSSINMSITSDCGGGGGKSPGVVAAKKKKSRQVYGSSGTHGEQATYRQLKRANIILGAVRQIKVRAEITNQSCCSSGFRLKTFFYGY